MKTRIAKVTTTGDELIELLQALVERGGPAEGDWPELVGALASEHGRQFVIQDGVSHRRSSNKRLELFLAGCPRVFHGTATMQGFARCKPHGYAGDFEIIERIYNMACSALADLSAWDRFFHAGDAARAVRNRASVLRQIIGETRPRKILTVGCGPSLDILQATAGLGEPIEITFLDTDSAALARAAVNLGSMPQITAHFVHKNALRYRTDEKFDLIWSSGLFDYLNDKTAVFLLKRLTGMMADNGAICFGNFGHENRSRPYMEIIGEWFLRHRAPRDLEKLATAADIARSRFRCQADDTGLNLFALCA
ncbi:class I SAM-dependent methyltransferase [Mesorhizobium comanense]|uniref:class I SAM-dependent methyltransferase n=1 Tax=Mesorhizobium comanense TaxID=2502215 RepID=UPI0010F4774D|nr:class I SAM-dependent methyltransferase [Mesorhizobium comanense]